MRHWLLFPTFSLALACSSTDDMRSEGPPTEQDQENAKPEDAGRSDGGVTKRPDAGAVDAGSTPVVEPDFTECAASRTEAKRGLSAANVVWVVDTSGSMDEEAAIVQKNLTSFVDTTTGAGLEDYRVVMVSEESFVQVPDPLRSDATHFMYVEERVGSEEPLADLLSRFADYQSFLLPNVMTHFVVVTDDESELSADDFIAQMDAKIEGEFRVHAIASPATDNNNMPDPNDPFGFITDLIEGDGCTGQYGDASRAGVQNYQAAQKTGGLTFSICADDWTQLFTELASRVSEAAVPCNLEVPEAQGGGVVDPSRVNVVFTPPGGGKAITLVNVGSEGSCATKQGWFYDDPIEPTQISLCPTSCDGAAKGGALDIALGCTTLVQ